MMSKERHMTDDKKPTPEQEAEYADATRKILTGCQMLLKYAPQAGSHPYLFAGNSQRVIEFSALLALLIDKGIVTATEFHEALMLQCADEIDRLEQAIEGHVGQPVKLGGVKDLENLHVEPQLAILPNGDTVPAAYLVCPECGVVELNAKYDDKRKEFTCPKGHKWNRPLENQKVM
jgi:hypothetical protein